MKKALGIIALGAALLTGGFFSQNTEEVQASESVYSGEELFLGLAFGQGEVGEKFPTLWGNFDSETLNSEEAKSFGSGLTESIQAEDEEFFNEFQEAVYSGNVQVIEDAFEEAYPLINDYLFKDGLSVNMMAAADDADGQCVLFAVVAIGTAAVQHQYVYNHESFWTTSSIASADTSELEREKFVVDIVETF